MVKQPEKMAYFAAQITVLRNLLCLSRRFVSLPDMYIALIVLILLVCFLLGLIVLAQNPKGGGISSQFGPGARPTSWA